MGESATFLPYSPQDPGCSVSWASGFIDYISPVRAFLLVNKLTHQYLYQKLSLNTLQKSPRLLGSLCVAPPMGVREIDESLLVGPEFVIQGFP